MPKNIDALLTEEAIRVGHVLEYVLYDKCCYPHQLTMRHLANKAINDVYRVEVSEGKTPLEAALKASVWFGREEVKDFGY